ncbi:MAG: glycolate oxidase subunit GlcE [Alphaproteobacteria bacterium]
MATILSPTSTAEVREILAWAVSGTVPLAVQGHGSRDSYGRPVAAQHKLVLERLAGIISYEPQELVLTAHAGTTMTEIEAALAAAGQMLAFEPPDPRFLFGAATAGTLGGCLSTNLSGPRRVKAGAARDHFVGFQAVSGRAEIFHAGGKVVKNVTGYDLPKLMAGAFGTLGVLTEVTIRVVPAPADRCTLATSGLTEEEAGRALSAALNSPYEVSGAAHLPAAVASRLASGLAGGDSGSLTLVRLEGFPRSVASRADSLGDLLAAAEGSPPWHAVPPAVADKAWLAVRDVWPLIGGEAGDDCLWRIVVPAAAGPGLAAAFGRAVGGRSFFDWGGGLVWLATAAAVTRDTAGDLRRAAQTLGGHAALVRAPADLRRTIPVFQPEPDGRAALSRRVKSGFDPAGVLNPGRMVEGA